MEIFSNNLCQAKDDILSSFDEEDYLEIILETKNHEIWLYFKSKNPLHPMFIGFTPEFNMDVFKAILNHNGLKLDLEFNCKFITVLKRK